LQFHILAARNGLLAIDKPAGWLVIPGRSLEDRVCIKTALEHQLGTPIWVCHRLDRETSGVLVFATSASAHREASMAFEHSQVVKKYLALVEGVVRAPFNIDVELVAARKGKVRPAFPGEVGKPSRTEVNPMESFPSATLVECRPLTGRQHQIRVHLKWSGHPLLVDPQYGRREALQYGTAQLERTPLHAASIEIPALQFGASAPLAADMKHFVEALRL
jgi:RluA family pseudouridine synthase